jgi:hypothetical protein
MLKTLSILSPDNPDDPNDPKKNRTSAGRSTRIDRYVWHVIRRPVTSVFDGLDTKELKARVKYRDWVRIGGNLLQLD